MTLLGELIILLSVVGGLANGLVGGGEHEELIRINLVRETSWPAGEQIVFNYSFAAATTTTTNNQDNNLLNKLNIFRIRGFSYIGEVQVGEPAREFRLLLDTGSGDLWLPSNVCNGIDKTIIRTHDCQQSASFSRDGRPVKLMYGNGVIVSGQLGRELIQFGQLIIQNQTFTLAQGISDGSILQNFHVDGIVGLNFKSYTGYEDVEAPIWQILRVARQQSAGRPIKSVLSFSLNHGNDDRRAGEMIVGGLDESLYVGSIAWAPLMRQRHWQFRLDWIQLNLFDEQLNEPVMNEATVCAHGCEAIADTGTMLITGNMRDIETLNKAIGANQIARGVYALPTCELRDNSRLPHLTISISNRKFSLTPKQYIFEVEGRCYSAFKWTQRNKHWVLGSMFIGHFYAILDYDQERFGLAESPFKRTLNIVND